RGGSQAWGSTKIALGASLVVGLVSPPAHAQPNAGAPVVHAPSQVPADSSSGVHTSEISTVSTPGDEKWIRKYRPRAMSFEVGAFGGAMFPSREHELFNAYQQFESGNTFWQPYRSVAPEFGLRFAFYPFPFIGGEVEGGVIPTRVVLDNGNSGDSATLFNARAHVIGQLPFWRVAPFVLVGGGMIGTNGALGLDVDQSVHFGGGVKFFLNDVWMLRLDARDVVAAKLEVDAGATHYPEVLLGVGWRFGGKKDQAPKDSDGDGLFDYEDACPFEQENFNAYEDEDGCPEYDRDGDGFFDNRDACPDVPGIAPDGCPEKDRDGDGFLDSHDACPDVPGVEPDGCPIPDTDNDGILDPDDNCVTEPETVNGFEDGDGCPDEVPAKVIEFTGVIKGIYFDFNRSTIKDRSTPVLDRAVAVLAEFPSIHIEISGHTDNVGSAEYNKTLSGARAEAVKNYLTRKGVNETRIETRGAGFDEPVDTNKTATGRAKNRRIEFTILTQ
ncbi:MAG: OmpA family protein, partial [Nannocystaceae bacterium]